MLKEKLGLNRNSCRRLLDSDRAKKHTNAYRKSLQKGLSSGDRDRLLLFKLYGNPGFRRDLWATVSDLIQSGNDRELKRVAPSLEYWILSPHIQNSKVDSTGVEESFSKWPDLVQRVKEGIQGAHLAAYVWGNIRSRINSWGSLDDGERTDITLAAFAVATVVDDKRILRAVIEEVPDLQTEFDSIVGMVNGSDTDAEKEDVLLRWNELCESLGVLAEKAAGSPPVVDALAEIKQVVHDLSVIEQPVRESAPILLGRLMSRVNELLGQLEARKDFLWLGETERANLRAEWQRIQRSVSIGQIRGELERLDRKFPAVVQDYRRIAVKLSEVESRYSSLRAKVPADLPSRHSLDMTIEALEVQMAALRRERRTAESHLLNQLSPFGDEFQIGKEVSPFRATPDARESVTAPSAAEPECPPPYTTEPAKPPAASPTSYTGAEQQEAEESEMPDCPGTSTDDEDVEEIAHEPIPEGGIGKLVSGDDGELEPAEPVAPLLLPEAKRPKLGDSRKADSLAARATERMSEALLESPPRISYAVQVARLITRLDVDADLPPVALLEAALLADHLSIPDGTVASELAGVLARFPSPNNFSDTDDSTRDLYIMLALAGTLRPALLSPQTGAWGLLSALKPSDGLGSVYKFVNRFLEKSQNLQAVRIDSTVLTAASSEADWSAEREQLKFDATKWQERAQHMTMVYAPATRIWQWWLKRDGLIANLMSLITSGGDDDAHIADTIGKLKNQSQFSDLVKKTDRNELARKRGPSIQARALTQLYEHTQHVVRFADRHLSLSRSRPSQSNFVTQELMELRSSIKRLGRPALRELQELASGEPSLFTAAANTAAYATYRFNDFIDNGLGQEPDPKQLLDSELFYFPSIPFDADGSIVDDPRDALNILLSTDRETIQSSLDQLLSVGNFKFAERLVNWNMSDLDDREDIQSRFDKALRSEKMALRSEMEDTRTRVEIALSRGHLSDIERDHHSAVLVEMERRIAEPGVADLDHERTLLCKIGKEIEGALDKQRSRTTALLDDSEIGGVERQSILRLIEQGDIITANELIDRNSQAASPMTEMEQRQVFQEFYSSRCVEIDMAIERARNPKRVVEQIGDGEEFGGMILSDIPGAQRNSAKQMLNAWFYLKRAGRLGDSTKDHVTTLFSEMGFIMREASVTRDDRNVGESSIRTDPLRERGLCPIPAFGSFADGRYRVVFLWGRPTEEDILQHAEGNTRKQATIILYFGRLTKARRDGLAGLVRERYRTFLLIDELLLVFLCGQRGSRLPILFACSVPFTYVQPYVTTAGLVPPEMFYGREQEIRDIINPNGSCFIYGGRQLGKTVLLRAVERAFHRPTEDSYAIWIDLKGKGIGYDREVAEIWLVLWRELQKILRKIPDDIKEPNPNIGRRVNHFIDFLSDYFHKSKGRVLLLLLDEADRFLELDAREIDSKISNTGYRESTRLKALMDQTERSIKVVFAGLHNVLRTVEYSNHPLAHFGDAIEVGPLWRSAEALIRQPLLASGYQFENDHLVTRILAQTNYYPNLIQLYGSELIRSMCSRKITGPPLYEIVEGVLDHAYTNLREMIRSRFHMTLQLDPRYEVIAYSIAHHCYEAHDILSKGLDYRRIEDISKDWWQEGFKDVEIDHFRSLLDEMKGLGILRKAGDHRYTLRNPNVLLLMGTIKEIDDNLLKDRELPQEFEPKLFRSHNPHNSDSPSRSPLTYQQENLLREKNRVSIVCGLKASGLDNVLRFLKAREASDSVIELKNPHNHCEFVAELTDYHKHRPKGTTIYTIPHSVPWSEKWIQEALESIRKLRSKDRNVHVLFIADPTHLLRLDLARSDRDQMEVQWILLRPWENAFLHQWMDDVGFGNSPEVRRSVADLTGGWPVLLERLYDLYMAQETGRNLDTALESLDDELGDVATTENMQRNFGLDGLDMQKKTLLRLAQFGEAEFGDLKAFAEEDGIDCDTLRRTLNWAQLLHLAKKQVDRSTWQMDPVAARLFQMR